MKYLITGITGFAGSHLAEYLLNHVDDAEVYGSVRWRSHRGNLAGVANRVRLFECELRDASSVRDLLELVKPDHIFHLAGHSFETSSWNCPGDTMVNNIVGVINLLEAARKSVPAARIMLACSGEEYGKVSEDELPIREETPFRPLSPHGVSKLAQDFLGYQYYECYGMDIVRTRAFAHIGPRGGEALGVSALARQIAEIELGARVPVVYAGNLETRRDLTDVRDVVRGYWIALELGKPGEVYQICSGQAYTLRQVWDVLLSLTEAKIEIGAAPFPSKPSDTAVLLGSYQKFRRDTGWEPVIPLTRTLKDVLDYWRAALRHPKEAVSEERRSAENRDLSRLVPL